MALRPIVSVEGIRALIARGEGQFLELKGTWTHGGNAPRPLGKDEVRRTVAQNVAAFANADGGLLVIGIEDDGSPTGHGRSDEEVAVLAAVSRDRLTPPLSCDHQLIAVDGHEVLVIEVGRAPAAVMVNGGGFPYRTGEQVIHQSQDWIERLKRSQMDAGVEKQLVDGTVDDLDLTLLPAGADEAWLDSHGLVLKRYGSPAITTAAVLLAARGGTARWRPNAGIRIFRVDGTERQHGARRNVVQIARIDEPIIRLIPAAHEVLRGQIRRSERLHDLFFREFPEYPTFAWQEAVVNAVAHRDYSDQGRGVEVWLFDDRMEVTSPGLPLPPVTIEELREGRGVHASRNPLIARVLVELGAMREEGEGIPRMFDEMQRSFLRNPVIEIAPGGLFRVVLFNTPIFDSPDDTWRLVVERLTDDPAHRRVLLAHPGGFTNEQYRSVNGVDRDEAYRQISAMVAAGIVQPADRVGRGATYLLQPDLLSARSWLQQRVPAVIEHLAVHGSLTNADYRELFGVPRAQARVELRRLVDEGVLDLVGERRTAHYVRGRSGRE